MADELTSPARTNRHIVDLERMRDIPGETGIFLRAQRPDTGAWISADIAHLTRESLLAWLAARDGEGEGKGAVWRDSVICVLLGHKP